MKKSVILSLILSIMIVFSSFGSFSVIAADDQGAFCDNIKTDNFESYTVGDKFTWGKTSSKHDYHTFGSYSTTAELSDTVAYSGDKSLKVYSRCDDEVSLKFINLFEATDENVGKTFDISFMIYADKNAGVYKNDGTKLSDCVPYTEEELKESEGTVFNITMAGGDGDNYKYRIGTGETKSLAFVKWNTWTKFSTQFTLTKAYVDNGSTVNGKNPAINAFRFYQKCLDGTVNGALCDTFYIDDVVVQTTGASVSVTSNNPEYTDINVNVSYYKPQKDYSAKAIACEYDKNKLINITSNDVFNVSASASRYPVNDTFEVKKKSMDSDLKVYVLSSEFSKPVCPSLSMNITPGSVIKKSMEKYDEYANNILASSTATYADAIAEEPVIDGNRYLHTKESAYTQAAEPNATRANTSLIVRSSCKTYMKFDLDNNYDKTAHAYLRLFSYKLSSDITPGTVSMYETGNNWTETNLTHNNAPNLGNKLTEMEISHIDVPYYFDLTDYVNGALARGEKEISIALTATGSTYVSFISANSTKYKYYRPSLILEGVGKTKAQYGASDFVGEGFVDIVHTSDSVNRKPYDKESIRVLSSLSDYTPVTKAPTLSEYGGWIDGGKYNATGYFRTELIDGRWWFIDPLGYKYIDMGVSQTIPSQKTDIQKAGFAARYGTEANWANQVGDELRSYGFNSMGPWSNVPVSLTADKPLNHAALRKSFLLGDYSDGVMNVFSPDFETHCDNIALEYIAPYADDPHIVGWYTDNEPPASADALKNALSKNSNAYTYSVSWKWYRMRRGQDASVGDITKQDCEDWIEFMYDRYMQVVTNAIRKYDKNHMIFGPKLDKNNRAMFRSVGRYADAIGYDYYPNAFTPDRMGIIDWYKWGGKPLMNAEWYTKGYDACTEETGITNDSGVGYEVLTQTDRGYYYQTFALGMLDSRVFVGWQWFKYADNDPSDTTLEASNRDANKGIFTRDYKIWDDMAVKMKELNINAYNLTTYMDR